jgi:hypothetical protein
MQHQLPVHDPRHDRHDTFLIAALAAGDLTATDRARATAQLDGCGDCRAIHDDLVAIATFTRTLPAARAPRDFRLTEAQVAGLRRSWRSVLLAPFRPRQAGTRRLAAAFTTLGLVGVFVAGALPAFLGGATGSARTVADGGAGAQVATSAPAPALGPGAQPTAESAGQGPKDATASIDPGYAFGGDAANSGAGGHDEADVAAQERPNLLLIGSLALIAAGVLLFGLRFAGRRLR